MMKVPAFYSEEMSRFDYGEGHPFRGDRFAQFISQMERYGLKKYVEVFEPKAATKEDLLKVHALEYIERVIEYEQTGRSLSPDTPVMPGMFDASRLICGSALSGVRKLMSEPHELVLSLGGFHHAGRNYGEGFCIFNDVALAAQAALDEFGLKRVMIIDTDAHHGNGTQDIFYTDPRVLFLSIHQDPRTLYPGKGFVHELGEGKGKGFTVNVPMPPFSTDLQYKIAFESVILPVGLEFDPQLIIRNGGSDPYFGDDLTNLELTSNGLTMLGRMVRDLSDRTCKKMLDLTVSGYGNWVTEGWMAIIKGSLKADDVHIEYGPKRKGFERLDEMQIDYKAKMALVEIRRELGPYWKCLR